MALWNREDVNCLFLRIWRVNTTKKSWSSRVLDLFIDTCLLGIPLWIWMGMGWVLGHVPSLRSTLAVTLPPHIIVGNHSFKDLALAVVCIQMFMNIWVCKWSGIFRNHNLLHTQIVWTTYVLRTYVCIHTSHYKSTSTQLRKDTSTQVLHYTTLRYITLHYTTLDWITLHCIYITLHYYVPLHYITHI